MIVLDASGAVNLVLELPEGRPVAERLLAASSIHAPSHLDMEVGSALRRAALRGVIDDYTGRVAIDSYRSLSIRRWEGAPLMGRAFELRHSAGAGDALYIALAEALDAPLVTADARLARSHGHDAVIELVS